MSRYVTTGALGAVLLSLPLIAGAASGDDRPGFDEADANGDGVVTMEEAQNAGVPQEEAEREDIDDNGELTEADWKFIDMDPGAQTGSEEAVE